ncbi:YtxH domain-containing protein [Helicobacter pullorum]|uniref:YtxH domain-containing protein n=1 Tax=Helicobacter pullorum TaxID=35818 RepID=UPI00174C54CC|nr:YtxH domain-containing protein [Helicobacter pullorum]
MTNQPNPNNPYIQNNSTNTQQNADKQSNGILNVFGDQNTQKDFIKGALIGAVATFILTNENAQRAIFKGFAKVSGLFEAGIEELKERYEDAKAEVNSQE